MTTSGTIDATHRLLFVDFARSYAIALALLAHALGTFGVSGWAEQIGGRLVYLTATATPVFVFMFGFMIELVYVPKVRSGSFAQVRGRLRIRSFQCYVGYVATSLAALLGGYIGLERFLGSVVLWEPSRYGNILATYALILLAVPSLIRWRIRFGVRFFVVGLAALGLATSLLPLTKGVDLGLFNRYANLLLGAGTQTGGPSILGASIFVLVGMLLASSVGSTFNRTACIFLAILFALICGQFVISGDGAKAFLNDYTHGPFRQANHLNYYLFGSFFAVASMAAIRSGLRLLPLRRKRLSYFLPLGMFSLVSFCAGNIYLSLLGRRLQPLDATLNHLIFFAALVVFVRFHQRLPFYRVTRRLLGADSSAPTP